MCDIVLVVQWMHLWERRCLHSPEPGGRKLLLDPQAPQTEPGADKGTASWGTSSRLADAAHDLPSDWSVNARPSRDFVMAARLAPMGLGSYM